MLLVGDPRGWWLLALAGLFLVVFLLRGRRRRLPSSLFFLVRRLAERLTVEHRRLQLRRRLALALFAAAAVATAAAGLAPRLVSKDRPFHELAIVDLSPSLGTSERGAPRLLQLREHLDRYLDQLQDQDSVLLVTAGPQAAATTALRGSTARAAARSLDYADTPADVAGAARLAATLAGETRFDHVRLFTDRPGRWEEGPAAAHVAALAPRIITFGAAGPNAGLEAFDFEPDPLLPAAFDFYLRLSCPAPSPAGAVRDVTLTLLNNERELQRISRECVPGQPQEVLLEDVPLERGQVEVRLAPGGAYAGDDRVLAGVSDAPVARVILVSPGNHFLRAALEALPGVEVTVLDPEQTPPPDPRAIYVFDGKVPAGDLPEKALFIQPDRALDTLAEQTYRLYPERIVWESDDPLLRGVDLEGLSVNGFLAYADSPGFRVAATADGWPLILARDEGSRRWVVFAFNPSETNLVYTAAFPVLIASTVRWLSLFAVGERPYYRCGEAVFLPAAARGGQVRTPSGEIVPITSAAAQAFLETRHPGRYQVRAADGSALGNFYVNVADPAVTAAVAAEGYGRGLAQPPPGLSRGPLRREFAPLLALFAVALLAAEKLLATARGSQREPGPGPDPR